MQYSLRGTAVYFCYYKAAVQIQTVVFTSRPAPIIIRGGADKSLARPGKKTSYSEQTRDLFNILPTKLNTLLSPLLSGANLALGRLGSCLGR